MTKIYFQTLLLVFVLGLTVACEPDPRVGPMVRVTVLDSAQNIIEFADVTLTLEPLDGSADALFSQSMITDFEGVVIFNLFQIFQNNNLNSIIGEVDMRLRKHNSSEDSLRVNKTIVISIGAENDYQLVLK